ncbi:MAG: PD-(D/E)XK nuclease family protein [Nitrosomonas sp.]|nr:PD-(D/E)XK nuclease family protein [Nitrosomonas sp.]
MKQDWFNSKQVNINELLKDSNQNTIILTGNQRLTSVLRGLNEQVFISQQLNIWKSPFIMPWSSWLLALWEESLITGLMREYEQLLSPWQEHIIWQEVLEADFSVKPTYSTIQLVQNAWQLVWSWCIPRNESLFNYNQDSLLFWKWMLRFQSICNERNFVSVASITSKLQQFFKSQKLKPPRHLILTGFDELNPQQLQLLTILDNLGCQIEWVDHQTKASQVSRLACKDVHEESVLMARWVRKKKEDNPAARIGIVVPELHNQRDAIQHALDENLMPEIFHPGNPNQTPPYNFSLGKTLNLFPPISAALSLFNIFGSTLRFETVSQLLRSPFIGGWAQESGARALLDIKLREAAELVFTIDTLIDLCTRFDHHKACPIFMQRLQFIQNWVALNHNKVKPGQWSARFDQLLEMMGWLKDDAVFHEAFQLIRAWRELLVEFAALDWVMSEMTATDAVNLLNQMTSQRIFQPQVDNPAIQILGPLEAQGIEFDYLWVAGLHDGAWPVRFDPNPFIPISIQRKYQTPHSSEHRELAVATQQMHRILGSADEAIVSYPEFDEKSVLRPSPLIKTFTAMDAHQLALSNIPLWRDIIYAQSQKEEIQYDAAPSVKMTSMSGGSRVFELQAACPFRAFAELRLHAYPQGKVQMGLNAMVRGNLVHQVMEKIWGRLHSHQQLMTLSETQLANLVRTQVTLAIDGIQAKYPYTLTKRFRMIEIERISAQIDQWLALEKTRTPFEVTSREQAIEIALSGLKIKLKIDRIDTLDDGRQIIIDYKTGNVSPSEWFGDRPDKPQLPLYSLAVANQQLAGIVFAQLRVDQIAFSGIVAKEGLLLKVKSFDKFLQTQEISDWSAVITRWQSVLENLAQQFLSGQADVSPKKYPNTCQHCSLQVLCRINEATLLSDIVFNPETEE